jgi:hypothetical protein
VLLGFVGLQVGLAGPGHLLVALGVAARVAEELLKLLLATSCRRFGGGEGAAGGREGDGDVAAGPQHRPKTQTHKDQSIIPMQSKANESKDSQSLG